jgi:hypothetical protein
MECPNCNKKIKTSAFLFQNTTVRCECGTRVTVAPGFFQDSIVDWETSKERQSQPLERSTMFCNECGQELPENSKFCNTCGVSLSTTTKKEITKKRVFVYHDNCPECSKRMEIPYSESNISSECPYCNTRFTTSNGKIVN